MSLLTRKALFKIFSSRHCFWQNGSDVIVIMLLSRNYLPIKFVFRAHIMLNGYREILEYQQMTIEKIVGRRKSCNHKQFSLRFLQNLKSRLKSLKKFERHNDGISEFISCNQNIKLLCRFLASEQKCDFYNYGGLLLR